MVEELKKTFEQSIGKVRINTEDLIAELKKYDEKGYSISAENGKYRFSNLDDMRDNSALLSGYPSIEIDGLRVSFYKFSTTLLCTYNSTMSDENNAERLSHYLSKYVSIFSKYDMIINALVIINIGLILTQIFFQPIFTRFPIMIVSISILGICLAIWKLEQRDAVFYNPRETFWQRHSESIVASVISGTIMLIIGTAITWALKE